MSPRRTRRGVSKQDISPSTAKKAKKAAVSPKETSRSLPKKRITRAAKTKFTSDSEDNQTKKVSKKSSRKKSRKSEADSLITEDESITESPRGSSILKSSLLTDDESTPRTPPGSRSSVTRVDTTPKSSPLVVPLTPHRSRKTPRRSPVNIGSPKTHSDTPLRLSKTPRKLEIKDSPEESKPDKNEGRAGSKSPNSRSKPKSPSPKKSPKLKNARKSAKQVARKSQQSPSLKNEKSSTRMNQTVSAVSKKVAPKSPRRSMSASKLKKPPIKLRGSISPKVLSKIAVVMLEKLEDSTENQKSTPVKTPPRALGNVSPKRAKSTGKKRSSVTELGTPLRPIVAPKIPKSSLKMKAETDSATRRQTRKDVIINFSTPKEGLRRSLNLSKSLEEASPLLKEKSSTLRNKSRSFSAIENESEPAMSDTSLINMSDVFDSDVSQKEEKEKDGTYEVIEPKTPSLLAKKTKKRSSMEAKLNKNETENKKVRFVESEVAKNTSFVTLRSGTPGHKLSLKRMSEMRSKSKSPPRLSKGLSESVRRRSSSLSVVEGTPRTPANKTRINAVVGSNLKSGSKAQMASVNRLSRPRMSLASEKKTDTKTPVPRRIPNFAEIHKKNFEKMESIVDAKKRVAQRHVLNVNPLISASKSMPEVALGKRLDLSKLPGSSQVGNGGYNRFGFKVRKNQAVESIGKKQSTVTSEKKKSARREILKGVRTNRRFELQMKSRKSLGSK